MTALREIKLLKELRSPHLVQLIDVFPHKHNLLLVRHSSRTDSTAILLMFCTSATSPPIHLQPSWSDRAT